MDIYAKAEAELNSIEQQIAALQRRQVELRQFVNLGRKLFEAALTQTSLAFPTQQATEQSGASLTSRVIRRRRDDTMKARILTSSEALIKTLGPLSTKALVLQLEASGVEVGGVDKAVTVGVILSRSDRFKADRTHGWSLADAENVVVSPWSAGSPKENPQDAPTSAGSFAANAAQPNPFNGPTRKD